jgi:hypothetical protein
MHQQVGYGSLHGYFSGPAEVSAHFWVAKTGAVEQYADTQVQTWHARNLNDTYVGVECEGYPEEALTEGQLDGFAALMREGHDVHGWPLVLCERDGQAGLGYHRMPGFDSSTQCPSALRLAQRQTILDRAGAARPAPAPDFGGNMIASTSTGNGYWTTTRDGAVGAFGDAQYKGGGFSPDIVTGEIVGIAGRGTDGYWLLASDGGVLAFGSATFLGRPDRV